MFRGPKAYQELVSCPEVDLVQISTPDIFHPQHLEAAVNAGKHIYCEKPVAVDVSGCRRVVRIGEQVRGRFSLEIGFQLRSVPPYVELVRRIHAGGLGKIACGGGGLPLHRRLLPAAPQRLTTGIANSKLLLGPGHRRRHHRGPKHPPARSVQLDARGSSAQSRRHGRQTSPRGFRRLLGPLRCHLHVPPVTSTST